MKKQWETIEHWLAENASELKGNLNPAATDAEIAAVEKTLGVRFPQSVRDTYLIHNGESQESDGLFGLWRLLPLDEVVTKSNELAELGRQFEFHDFDPSLMIPILEASGDFYCIQSSAAGEETPVVEWWHESPSHEVEALNFCEFVKAFVEKLNRGRYVYRPDELMGLIDVDEL